MQLLIKIGSKYHERFDSRHRSGWRDGQIIDIRDDGAFVGNMERKHHCVIELPNVDFWKIRGSRNWKSTKKSVRNLKKYLSVSNQHATYLWQNNPELFQPKDLKREWFIDFQELLNQGYITLSDFESIYDKSRNHNQIVLSNVHDFTSILKNENIHTRLNTKKDHSKGTISTGTYQIGTGTGADYSTITSFEADIAATLTGNLTGEHQAEETAISDVVRFDTDTNSYKLKLTTESGAKHDGKWNTSKARINFADNDYISLFESTDGTLDDVIVENLQLDIQGASNRGIYCYDGANSGEFVVRNNIIKGDGDSSDGIYVYYPVANVKIYNNIVYDISGSSKPGIHSFPEYAVNNVLIANNTVINCGRGIWQEEDNSSRIANHIIKNNLVQDCGTCFVDGGGGYGTHAYNVSEDTTSPDTSYRSLNCHNGNSCFVDYANDDFRLTTGGDELSTLDDGDDLSGTFTDDIVGTIRSTWYIGAYEYVTVGEEVELIGSLAGGGSLTGNLKAKREISGLSAGVSAVSGSIEVTKEIASNCESVSIISGSIEIAKKVIGEVAASSELSGSLGITSSIDGTIDSVSSISGSLKIAKQVSGVITNASSITGTVKAIKTISGIIVPESSIDGQIKPIRTIAGISEAVSATAGSLTVGKNVAGEVAGISDIAGSIKVTKGIVSSATAESSVAGSIKLLQTISGTVSAVSTIEGFVKVAKQVIGNIDSVATIEGIISTQAEIDLAGIMEGESSANAILIKTAKINGTIESVSDVTGSLKSAKSIIGSIDSVSNVVGNLKPVRKLVSSIAAISNITGNLLTQAEISLSGTISNESAATGFIELAQKLTGNIASVSSSESVLKIAKQIQSEINSQSAVNGLLKSVKGVSGSVSSESNVTGVLKLLIKLFASLNAESSIVGDLIISGQATLIGSIIAQSDISSNLKYQASIQGAINSLSELSVIAKVAKSIQGEAVAQSNISGIAELLKYLNGIVNSISEFSGNVARQRSLQSEINAQSVFDGAIKSALKIQGLIASQSDISGILYGIELIGSILAESGIEGVISLQKKLTGNVVVNSGLTGNLSAYVLEIISFVFYIDQLKEVDLYIDQLKNFDMELV